jgi:hypothetical protein
LRRRLPLFATTVAFAAVVAAAPAGAAVVDVRVDSSLDPAPLFEGTVTTLPHAVDGGDGSGAHACAGPSSAAPSATATGALDDAMRLAGIPWRGNWDPSFHDFFIDRIGVRASSAPDLYWSLTVNGRFASGGCLARVGDGDTVRFSYGPLFGGGSGPEESETPAGQPSAGDPETAAEPASRTRIRRIALAATRFLRRRRGAGEEWARLALALRGGGDVPGAARAILGDRLGRQRPDGSLGGEVNATALAVLALAPGPGIPSRAARRARACAWLASAQEPGGGFGYRPGIPPDVDSTGLAAWGLALCGRGGAVGRGGAFVRAAQASDGGFPSLPGGAANAQSTGLGLVALRLAAIGPDSVRSPSGATPLDRHASLARRDGSIAYSAGASPTPVWTTAQALLGLTSTRVLLAAGERRG